MKLHKVLITLIVVLAAAAAFQMAAAMNQGSAIRYVASWVASPETVEEAVELSESIVLGRVIGVERADDLVVRAPGEPEGIDRIPTEVVKFEVKDVIMGDSSGTEALFHTGLSGIEPHEDQGANQANERTEEEPRGVLLDDDPEYREGEVYALFLTQGPESKINGRALQTKRPVAPEGRFRVTENGTLESMTDRGFAGELNGAPLEKLIEQIRRAMEKTGRQ